MSILSSVYVLEYSSEANKLEVNANMLQPFFGWKTELESNVETVSE